MQNERNGAVDVHGNRTVNFPAPVPHTKLWASCEMLGRLVMNIFSPYIIQDV
jgi:hypothetical protein